MDENDVVSLDYARKLKTKGVIQESAWYWQYQVPSLSGRQAMGKPESKWSLVYGKLEPPIVSAFSLEEIKSLIDKYSNPKPYSITKVKDHYQIVCEKKTFVEKKEVDVYVQLYLYLLSNV